MALKWAPSNWIMVSVEAPARTPGTTPFVTSCTWSTDFGSNDLGDDPERRWIKLRCHTSHLAALRRMLFELTGMKSPTYSHTHHNIRHPVVWRLWTVAEAVAFF